jgi:hypothetical protein
MFLKIGAGIITPDQMHHHHHHQHVRESNSASPPLLHPIPQTTAYAFDRIATNERSISDRPISPPGAAQLGQQVSLTHYHTAQQFGQDTVGPLFKGQIGDEQQQQHSEIQNKQSAPIISEPIACSPADSAVSTIVCTPQTIDATTGNITSQEPEPYLSNITEEDPSKVAAEAEFETEAELFKWDVTAPSIHDELGNQLDRDMMNRRRSNQSQSSKNNSENVPKCGEFDCNTQPGKVPPENEIDLELKGSVDLNDLPSWQQLLEHASASEDPSPTSSCTIANFTRNQTSHQQQHLSLRPIVRNRTHDLNH